MTAAAPDLYSRMRAYLAERRRPQVTVGTLGSERTSPRASQTSLARARVQTGDPYPYSLSISDTLPTRVSDKRDGRRLRLVLEPNRPRWSDLSGALFWLYQRGWPALDVGGESIAGEIAWRKWVSRAELPALLAVRDRVADDATD